MDRLSLMNRTAIVALMVLAGASCGAGATEGGERAAVDRASTSSSHDTGATTAPSATVAVEPRPIVSPSPAPTVPTPTTAAAEEPSVAWRTVELVDVSRPTETLDGDGDVRSGDGGSRSVPTIILYPGADGGGPDAPVADGPARPLALYLKGLGGSNAPTDPLLVTLAEAGYIVAAPNIREMSDPTTYFPGYVEQPADARFVIDALSDPNDGFVDDLAPLIDPQRIGVVGHSLGATGAFGLAYHECCRDDRVSAVVAFGANPSFTLGEPDFEFAGAPLLLVYGTVDEISPVELGMSILDRAQAPSHLLTLPGGDHFQPVYAGHAGGEGGRELADIAATSAVGFLDLHVAGTTSQAEFDVLTGSLGPVRWRNGGA